MSNIKIHPLETACTVFVNQLNNEIKKAGQSYHYDLEIFSLPAEVDVPVKGTKQTKKKKVVLGHLLFYLLFPSDIQGEETKRILVFQAQVYLQDYNERINSYGWHGELCKKFMSVCFNNYCRMTINELVRQADATEGEEGKETK